MRRLLDVMDHPEARFRTILVAGSNGKGTAAAALESILRHAGIRTGLFTSPHLLFVRERFRVNGSCVSQQALREFLRVHGDDCRRVGASYFEVTTACALWMFARRRVQWAVLEIGLGGRLDACNVVDPEASIITSISREHTDYLGRTLAEIAVEKARVARRGRTVVIGDVQGRGGRALRDELSRIGARALMYDRDYRLDVQGVTARGSRGVLADDMGRQPVSLSMPGRNTLVNSVMAVEVARRLVASETLEVSRAALSDAVRVGLRTLTWPARLQVVGYRPLVVLDVAHNQAAIAALCSQWRALWSRQCPVLVIGLLCDKPAERIGRLLSEISDTCLVVSPESPRGVPAAALAAKWRHLFRHVAACDTIGTAIGQAIRRAGRSGSVLIAGSHFVVGPAYAQLGKKPCG